MDFENLLQNVQEASKRGLIRWEGDFRLSGGRRVDLEGTFDDFWLFFMRHDNGGSLNYSLTIKTHGLSSVSFVTSSLHTGTLVRWETLNDLWPTVLETFSIDAATALNRKLARVLRGLPN